MNKGFNVINIHITEKCNYRCRYCYAEFNQQIDLEFDSWKEIIDKISEYFIDNDIKGRINIAGGEPMLVKYLIELIEYIHSKNIEVSIITNASKLSREFIDIIEGKVLMIGVSIDSLNYDTNIEIGRNQGKHQIIFEDLVSLLNYAKTKKIKLKVNTVISKHNIGEQIFELYNRVKFDRIKLLQVRIQENCNKDSIDSAITDEEFSTYTKKVKSIYKDVVVETQDDLESSYIIIDPKGYLVSNDKGVYKKVGNILEESLEVLIKKANISLEKFYFRY